jgi:hypothetical protein
MSGDSRPNVANITGPQLATPSISFHQANHVPINAQTVNVQHFSHHNVPAISCVPIKKRKEDTGARKSSNMHHARQSRSHEQSVINRINEQLGELSSRNLKEQWMSSIKEPIDFISKRFQRLQLDGRPVQVRERVGNADVDKLHCKLKEIDQCYNEEIKTAVDLKKCKTLHDFMKVHMVVTKYSLSIQKCGSETCKFCLPIRAPIENGIRSLVMERQCTPRLDPERPGHFLSRTVLHQKYGMETKAWTCIEDLPSSKLDMEKQAATVAKTRDLEVSQKFGLRSWEAKKVRTVVHCYSCAKPRCIYSTKQEDYDKYETSLQATIEEFMFQCGDVFFPDITSEMGKIFLQKKKLTCSMSMERSYYNTEERGLVIPDVCFHCGLHYGILTAENVQKLCKSEGFNVYPICEVCIQEGKELVKKAKSRKNVHEAAVEAIEVKRRKKEVVKAASKKK